MEQRLKPLQEQSLYWRIDPVRGRQCPLHRIGGRSAGSADSPRHPPDAVSPAVDPKNTLENIATMANRLKLPAGWKYRTAMLEQDLILIPESGVATILKDALDDVYDLTGKGYSNFNP